ncbi:MAG: c-type cytochrome, partial [Candidatus Eisenbacteria bacterium]
MKEYALGVPAAGGIVTDSEELKEARLFLDQGRLAVPGLPVGLRLVTDSALVAMRGLMDRAAPPAEVGPLAAALSDRLARALGEGVVPTPPGPQSLSRGAAVFQASCASCHGPSGRGDGPSARGLSPPPANLADPQVMGAKSRVDLYRQLLLGVAGTAMPAFERTLPDSDRWDVAAYVLTLQSGGSSDAAVFAAVRRQVDSAVAARSSALAFDAYMTFEGVEATVRAKQPGLATRLEDEFSRLRERAPAATPAELETLHQSLLGNL